MKTLTLNSTVEEIEARRDEIALDQAQLQAEHRRLGGLLNIKRTDMATVEAEYERLGNIIAASKLEMEVSANG